MTIIRQMYFNPLMRGRKDWLNKPSLTTDALLPFLDAINLESEFINVLEPINEESCYRRFFGIPDEVESFVKFMFDLSLTNEVVGIDKDNDPCGKRNLLIVIRESTRNTNVDGKLIESILKKFNVKI